MAILDGIISAWRLEETSGNLIDAVGSNDLTASNLTYSVTGKVNNCVSFNGSTSQAIIGNSTQVGLNVTITEDRTFVFWFKSTQVVTSMLLDKRNVGDSPTPAAFQIALLPSGAISVFYSDDNPIQSNLTSATTGLNDGNWHLIIATFTRSVTGSRLYIDNVEDANSPDDTSSIGDLSNDGNFDLGRSGFSAGFPYAGTLDEVIIWNRVISAGERTTLWNSGAGTNIFSAIDVTVGIISAWQMEDASGNLTDTVGSNTLTATNLTYHQTGKVNFAIGLNGASSSATITDGAQVGLNVGPTDDRTIAVWFKSGSAVEQTIFGKPDDSQGGELYEMIMDSPGGVNVVFGNFSGNFAYVRSQAGYLNGQYHLAFVTFTRTNVGLRLFVDNVEFNGGPQPSPADASLVGDLTNTFSFLVGKRFGATSFWNGNIDEFIIWDRVLTSTERRTVWNNGNGTNIFIPPGPPPTVTSINPTSSYVQGGNTAFINGTGFVATPTISFGGTSATSIQFISPLLLSCVVPARTTPGAITVTVTNPDAQSATIPFNYVFSNPSNFLRPPKYFRSGILSFAQRKNGVDIYTP